MHATRIYLSIDSAGRGGHIATARNAHRGAHTHSQSDDKVNLDFVHIELRVAYAPSKFIQLGTFLRST